MGDNTRGGRSQAGRPTGRVLGGPRIPGATVLEQRGARGNRGGAGSDLRGGDGAFGRCSLTPGPSPEGRGELRPAPVLRRPLPGFLRGLGSGEIPRGWRPTYWGELVTLEYGKSLSGYNEQAGSYPVYGTNGRIGRYSAPLCKHPGVIVGRKGAYRGVHFCDEPFYVIDTAFYVEPRGGCVDLRWVYYELLRYDINSMDSGSAIPSTSREDFYSIPVLCPPFEVQQTYASLASPFWARQKQK
jgi:hypothetical protein